MPNNSTAKFLNYLTPKDQKTNDKQYIGIDGFNLFVEISSTVNYTATAPRFVTEDLKTAQDSIINDPKSLTIVGEVSDIFIEQDTQEGFGDVFQTILNDATPYLPDRTLSQIQKVEEFANEVDNTIQRIDNFIAGGYRIAQTLGIMTGVTPEDSPKKAFFDVMEQRYNTKQPVTIDTLYRRYENWVITSFSYEETNDGDTGLFTMTFEELRIINIDLFRNDQVLTPAEDAKVDVNTTLNGQLDPATDKGLSEGVPTVESLANEILENIGF